MPVYCKITKPDGFGNGTTISMAGYGKKDATQIDIFFKNPAGIYTFYMQLRWRPFEDVSSVGLATDYRILRHSSPRINNNPWATIYSTGQR
jgi:hypothetical protein